MQMEYKDRTYRKQFSDNILKPFSVSYKETDLWIGTDAGSYSSSMQQYALDIVRQMRADMDAYLETDPQYRTSLVPYNPRSEAPLIFRFMSEASARTGIGPMSAVAGAFDKLVADALCQRFGCTDVVVENGGDIYAKVSHDLDISVFAGQSPLSEKVGIHIPESAFPLGICTSSGTIGPSLSFGRADAMMIVCKDVLLADSYATAMANRIKTVEDLQPVIDLCAANSDILGALAVKDDRMAICGEFELRIFGGQHS